MKLIDMLEVQFNTPYKAEAKLAAKIKKLVINHQWGEGVAIAFSEKQTQGDFILVDQVYSAFLDNALPLHSLHSVAHSNTDRMTPEQRAGFTMLRKTVFSPNVPFPIKYKSLLKIIKKKDIQAESFSKALLAHIMLTDLQEQHPDHNVHELIEMLNFEKFTSKNFRCATPQKYTLNIPLIVPFMNLMNMVLDDPLSFHDANSLIQYNLKHNENSATTLSVKDINAEVAGNTVTFTMDAHKAKTLKVEILKQLIGYRRNWF